MLHLDHAATSHPKPPPVLAAVERWFRELGVSADRGDGHLCAEVAAGVQRTRAALGRMVGMPAERIAFTSGATESLNLFLRGFLRQGDRVLTTAYEHSSVVRPLVALREALDLDLHVLEPDAAGAVPAGRVADALASHRPRLLAFTHASNVTGAVLDAAGYCRLAREHGCTTLLDASQTAGLLPLATGADAVAASAHKSLLGPPGLGFLAARAGLPLRPQKQGGTGSARALERHPDEWPTAFEAGTPNTPAILGLLAALDWIAEHGPERLLAHSLALVDRLAAQLDELPAVRVVRPPPGPRIAVLSFTVDGMDPAEVGAVLDAAGIHVRTGFHCAPRIHHRLGTAAAGTVRVSPGPWITASDIDRVSAALAS